MRDVQVQDSASPNTVTLWLCAAGLCPPKTWAKTTSGPEVPICNCRVESKRGGFYRYRDREPVEVVPLSVADRYRDALGLLRGHVTDDEGWKLINDALWLGPRDENDDPIYTEKPT